MNKRKLWDIFCKVIDNYGDIGVCWRLSCDLADRGERVRLWVDDDSALRWMAPNGHPGVDVLAWTERLMRPGLRAGEVLIEAFGCDINPEFMAAYAQRLRHDGRAGTWINLEYLSAEDYVRRSHGLTSPVMHGPGRGLSKHFFFPGFSPGTGGLIREPTLAHRQQGFDRQTWLRHHGLSSDRTRLISLFCYEPLALSDLLGRLSKEAQPTTLLVTSGRAAAAVKACILDKDLRQPGWNRARLVSTTYLPPLTQYDFDHLLWACDLNFVRGEDSLVRAIWARKPFIWQIYPQIDNAHHQKLQAYLDLLSAPASLRAFHHIWNGLSQGELPALDLPLWSQAANKHCDLQQENTDLVSQLIEFSVKNN